MRVLLVQPSPLMYSEIYLRLEPLGPAGGIARVAGASVTRFGELLRDY